MEDARLVTITFCDRAENHAGMQIIGNEEECPFTYDRLVEMSEEIENSELVDISMGDNKACVLVARGYCVGHRKLLSKLTALEWDTKAIMYKKVVNKKARHNLCFAEYSQEADFENGKGTIVEFSTLPYLDKIRRNLEGVAGVSLVAEGNYYYNTDTCYIGYHGDAERNIVMGLRLGKTLDIVYRWYKNSAAVGDEMRITLNSGDLYIMSDKAVGKDWKKRSVYTLRHAVNPHLAK